jgi:GT2 family glycosyltransferase
MQPKVSIIILNYKTPDDTIECIESLKKIEYANYSVLIVDNHSNDGSVSKLKNKYPEIQIIENNENLGFAQGNNIAIQKSLESSPEYILLLNNDTLVDKCFLSHLVNELEKNETAVLAGPVILYAEKRDTIWSAGGTISWWRPRNIGENESIKSFDFNKTQLSHLSGCCILIKCRYLSETGLFDPGYFLYNEDTDLCLRVKAAGFQLLLVKDSKIWHKVGASSGSGLSAVSKYYGTRNRFLLLNKHAKLSGKLFFYFALLPLLILKNIYILSNKPKALKAFVYGVLDGISGRFGKNSKI